MRKALLERYRNDKNVWHELGFQQVKNEERGNYDANEKLRYNVLIELQYDRKTDDEALIRYLMQEEVKAREKDSFQGIGEALMLGSYLLACFKRSEDIALFWRAKCANFDTFCGYDRQFVLLALGTKTKAYAEQHVPDCFKEMDWDSEYYYGEHFQEWWDNLVSNYPASEPEEDDWVLFERYLHFEDEGRAFYYLKKLEQQNPETDYSCCYADLELWDKAIFYRKRTLESKTTLWDKVVAGRDLLDLYTKNENIELGIQLLKTLDQQLNQFDDWRNCGLGRMTIEVGFNFIMLIDDLETATICFHQIHAWQQQMENTAWVVLVAATKAAEHCGLEQLAQDYQQQADAERQRIDEELSTCCPPDSKD